MTNLGPTRKSALIVIVPVTDADAETAAVIVAGTEMPMAMRT
jgi:hypothetical protein